MQVLLLPVLLPALTLMLVVPVLPAPTWQVPLRPPLLVLGRLVLLASAYYSQQSTPRHH